MGLRKQRRNKTEEPWELSSLFHCRLLGSKRRNIETTQESTAARKRAFNDRMNFQKVFFARRCLVYFSVYLKSFFMYVSRWLLLFSSHRKIIDIREPMKRIEIENLIQCITTMRNVNDSNEKIAKKTKWIPFERLVSHRHCNDFSSFPRYAIDDFHLANFSCFQSFDWFSSLFLSRTISSCVFFFACGVHHIVSSLFNGHNWCMRSHKHTQIAIIKLKAMTITSFIWS